MADNCVSRRVLLRGTGSLALVTASAAGCDMLSTEPSTKEGDRRAGKAASEAPELARRVDSGDLPPLKERLPEKPLVIEPTNRAGRYGGTWHSAVRAPLGTLIYLYTQYENLLRWTPRWTGSTGTAELTENVVDDYTVNDAGTEFTFALRKGIKWSDGHPFTADDVVFAVEDVLLDKDIFPVTPAILRQESGSATVQKVDEHTFTLTFPEPAGMFLQQLAVPAGAVFIHYPRHYAKKFHKRYNPDVDELAEKEGFPNWTKLFAGKLGLDAARDLGFNAELPLLGAWRLASAFGKGERVELERNPYYWKVDSNGSQLPYLDRVTFDVVRDLDAMMLKATHGDITIEMPPQPRFTTPANKPVLARNRDKGGYGFVDGHTSRCNVMIIQLNLTHKDPGKRAIFQDKNFRAGLSHAMNRKEMVDIAMQGQGEPWQVAPLQESEFYDEKFASQYLEYDVDLAGSFLDKALPDRSKDGKRLGPDGAPLSIELLYNATARPEWTPMLELMREYWAKVGIELRMKNMSKGLRLARINANKHDSGLWQADGGLSPLLTVWPFCPTGGEYAVAWANWYNDGGEPKQEPPAEVKRQMGLYDKVKTTADPDQQAALMREVLEISRDQFYLIGVARETGKYFIADKDVRNIPGEMIEGWTYPNPGPSRPEQYWTVGA